MVVMIQNNHKNDTHAGVREYNVSLTATHSVRAALGDDVRCRPVLVAVVGEGVDAPGAGRRRHVEVNWHSILPHAVGLSSCAHLRDRHSKPP